MFAILCPGQGSQSPGMLDPFTSEPITGELIRESEDLLGKDLLSISRDPSLINKTTNTQLLMFLSSICAARLWFDLGGGDPVFVAGHSLGEYSALTISGVINFSDALKIVDLRSRAMEESCQVESMMLAVMGLNSLEVENLCEEVSTTDDPVSVANYNSELQNVVAGTKVAVERLREKLGRARSVVIPMSVPSHCILMKPAVDRLKVALESVKFNKPKFPVIQNLRAEVFEEVSEIRRALVDQLVHPVRWLETIEFLVKREVLVHLECGAGKVLSPLSKRIDKRIKTFLMANPELIRLAIEEIKMN